MESVFIVDEDTASIHSGTTTWDDERGIVALRRYYELRDEAEHLVKESQRTWEDTPFSIYAVQSESRKSICTTLLSTFAAFDPPRHPSGMRAMLQHSLQTYGPLPSELRPRRVRSRTSSRVSPYPSSRTLKVSASPELVTKSQSEIYRNAISAPLHEIPVNSNAMPVVPPSMNFPKTFSAPPIPDEPELKGTADASGLPVGSRVGSTARRPALGWAKRGAGKPSLDKKENQITPQLNNTSVQSFCSVILRLTS